MSDDSPQLGGPPADPADLDRGFRAHDERALESLPAEELAAQVRARETVWLYVDDIWHRANAAGLDPDVDPEWLAVARLRRLTASLYERARTVATAGGED